uniref:Chromosome 8 open reading frame 58 n=1 Tax=Ursus americanus TaxID=9643 RepID=A0A452SJF6_URSAM
MPSREGLGLEIKVLRDDGVAEDLAHGCVVPGVSSTYRRIPDAAQVCSLDSWKGDGPLRGLGRQEPLLKLASRDSGVEMVVGDSPLTTSPGLSQDSLDFEPTGSPAPLGLASLEPAAHLGRLLASRKLEQVLERSCQLPTSPASVSRYPRSLKSPSEPECEMPLFGAGEQEAAEAETALGAGVEEAEVAGGLGPEAWACLPGQGLRYLEHLCLVLEQMARLQQLCLQLQTQRPPQDPEAEEEEEEGEPPVAPSPPPSRARGHEVHEQLSQMQGTGAKPAAPLKVRLPGANPPRLLEATAEPAHIFPPSQGPKVKVLLNRIRWRSPKHPESPAPPDGPGTQPRIESRGVPERPPCQPLRKTFMPSFVVKKQRAKNLSVC